MKTQMNFNEITLKSYCLFKAVEKNLEHSWNNGKLIL